MPAKGRLRRLNCIAWIVLALVAVMGARLFELQVLRYRHFRSLQARQLVRQGEVPARRGRILDRLGRPLAFDIVGYDISVIAKHLRPDGLRLLAEVLREEPAALSRTLERGGPYLTLRRGMALAPAVVRRLRVEPGVCLEKRNSRQYPFGSLASQVLGFTDAAGRGAEGVEKAFDGSLRGTPGEVVVLKDDDGHPIAQRSRREPVPGADVHLTLDVDLQMIADSELQSAVRRYRARGGSVLIMEPETGVILACASAPAPGDRAAPYDPSVWRNRAVYDLFEPGSTLKPITAIACLKRGLVVPETRIHAGRGALGFGRAGIVHDAHEAGDGWLSFAEAFARSSNICFAKLARALPPEVLYDELRAFGCGSRTGIQFPGEPKGTLPLPRDWSGRTRLCLGYGQGMSMTAVQLAGLYTTIANGGRLFLPQIADRIVNRESGERWEFEPHVVRRPMTPELAVVVQELCRLAVTQGTGGRAQPAAVTIAGKTGTAQKAVDGRYAHRYVATFGGFVPAENPQLVCVVVLDEPRGVYHWGGLSAAPTFRRIVESIVRTTRYLDPKADRVALVHGDRLLDDRALESPLRFVTLDRHEDEKSRGLRVVATSGSFVRPVFGRLALEPPLARASGVLASIRP